MSFFDLKKKNSGYLHAWHLLVITTKINYLFIVQMTCLWTLVIIKKGFNMAVGVFAAVQFWSLTRRQWIIFCYETSSTVYFGGCFSQLDVCKLSIYNYQKTTEIYTIKADQENKWLNI